MTQTPPVAAAKVCHGDWAPALAEFDSYWASMGLRLQTRKQYRSIANRFLRWLQAEDQTPTEFSRQEVEGFLNDQDIAPTTRDYYRTILCRIIDLPAARSLIPASSASSEEGSSRGGRTLTIETLPVQFAGCTAIERQATVDAAAVAMLFHNIYLFTAGQGGNQTDVPLCEAVLQLADQFEVIPFSGPQGIPTVTVTSGDSQSVVD